MAVKLILFPNTKLFEEINGEKIYLELRSIIFPKHRILSKIIPPTKSGICTTTTHRSLGLLLLMLPLTLMDTIAPMVMEKRTHALS